jgi:dCMP deaminase
MKKTPSSWNRKYIELTQYIAQWSKDRSTKVGAVIVSLDNRVISMGYNGFCRGIDDDLEERHERPAKYFWTEHAERNAIYNAAFHGIKIEGATLYCSLFPCVDCARAIIQSGIKNIHVLSTPDFSHKTYGEQFKVSLEMFREADVNIFYINE